MSDERCPTCKSTDPTARGVRPRDPGYISFAEVCKDPWHCADRPVPDPEMSAEDRAIEVLEDLGIIAPLGIVRALAAAGLLRAPDPALAERLRQQVSKYDHLEGDAPRKGFIVLDDVRAAADALRGTQ